MKRKAPTLPAGFGAKLKALIASGHPPREAMKLAWRGVGRRQNAPASARPSRALFCSERVAPPSKFAPGSFRTVKVKGHRVTVGCPKGHFHRGRCDVGTQAQRILHPAGERGTCPVPGRELQNRATPRAQLDVGTVNLEASDEVSALVIGVGGLRPSAGLRGEFREVPMRFKRRGGKPLDELAQEIAEAQGKKPADVQDKILEALKRRARVFGEQERASTRRPPAGVDVPREDWRRMSDAERAAAVEFFRAGTAAPTGGGTHRPRVRVQADRFILGLHSPWKGRVSAVNPGGELKAIVEDVYEGRSTTPTLRHVFFGKTQAEARAVRLAHAESDRFFSAAIRGANFRGIPLRSQLMPSHMVGAMPVNPNPLTRAESAQIVSAARWFSQRSRDSHRLGLTSREMGDPAAVVAARAYAIGFHDAYLAVESTFGVKRRRRAPATGRRKQRALGFRRALRNPPRGAVEIYGRVLEIKAQKGRRSRYPGQRFVHRFTHGGPVLGLPGGELLIAGGAR